MDERNKWEEREKKKRYLRSYRESAIREKDILLEIEELRMEKMQPSLRQSDGMPKAAGTHTDLSDYMVRLDSMISKLIKEKSTRLKKREKIEKRISRMADETEKRLLRLRYIKGMGWEEICTEMGYSWSHIHRLHNSAVDNF